MALSDSAGARSRGSLSPQGDITLVQSSAQPRILVGLDSQSRALDIPGALARYGFEVRAAFEGDAVLRLAESWKPQSAVIDLSISGMPALEVGRHIRRRLGQDFRLVG